MAPVSCRKVVPESQRGGSSCVWNSSLSDEGPLEKLQKLQREKLCKICMDRDVGVVFIPCGHLAACEECSVQLVSCPICCGDIRQKVKTYIT